MNTANSDPCAGDSAQLAEHLASGVENERLMAHIAEFARWQKQAGSEGEAQSLRYVRMMLDQSGFTTRMIRHPAYISLPGPASLEAGERTFRVITHSMACSSPTGGLTRRLVDLGAGSEADFAAADVSGAIVILDGMATPGAALLATKAGAAGQIHVSPHEHLHEMCLSPLWGNPSTENLDWLPTTVVVTLSDTDGDTLRAALKSGELREVTIHASVDTGWRQIPILEADLAADIGSDEAPCILFSGHHDTWYEGVMDNGGANATMLEVARLLARQSGRRRHLRLCFWSGHSQGRYSGSAWYADTRWQWLERYCAVHVNVDSTGGLGNDDLSRVPVAAELADLARGAIMVHSGQEILANRMGRNADQSFWGVGIPSIFSIFSQQPREIEGVRNALGWWWHTPHDLSDKIDPVALSRDTRVYVHVLARLLFDSVLPFRPEAQLAELQRSLEAIDLPASCDVPLAELRERAAVFQEKLSLLSGRAADPRERDSFLMRLSRHLVPLDYTTGDRYGHDLSLAQAAWPSLDPLRRLSQTTPGSDDFLFCQGPAIRAANRLLSVLRAADEELDRHQDRESQL